MAKKFIVLDVEGYSNLRPYNIGWVVADKNGTIYTAHNVACMPSVEDNLIERITKQNNASLETANIMAQKNIHEILTDTKNKYEKVFGIDEIFNMLLTDITAHEIKRIWAYNVTFDRSALARLFSSEQFEILSNLVCFCDIITAITHTYLLSKDYVKFCIENDFITAKKNVRSTAEIVYRYLFNDLTFEEEHTGLADVMIELKILTKAIEKAKSPKRKPCQAWRLLRQFCEVNDIIIY